MRSVLPIALLSAFLAFATACNAQDVDPGSAAVTALKIFAETGETHLPFISLDAEAKLSPKDDPASLRFWTRSGDERAISLTSAPVVSADQVHVIASFREADHSGNVTQNSSRYIVLTRRESTWAPQVSIVLSDPKADASAIEATKSTLDQFFTAWNAADNEAIHKQINFPHLFFVRDGRTSIAKTPDELITDFDAMREREGWAKSEYYGFEVIHADTAKVIAKLTFTRHHADGTVYRTVPVVWVFTNQDGHWGLQMRLILPAVEND